MVPLEGLEIWRGGVNAWECDEMGHWNTRFYVARSVEGLAWLAAELGLPGVLRLAAATTLTIREQHIRFHREARAGAALVMTAGVTEIGETEAAVLQVLRDGATGAVAATFRTRVAHVSADALAPLPWPENVRRRAEAFAVEVPPEAMPRSVGGESTTDSDHLQVIARGLVGPALCDPFGRMRAETFIGCVAEGSRHLMDPLRTIVVDAHDPRPARVGGAVLEFRILHFGWPRLGDRFEVRSGFLGTAGNAFRLAHRLLDPDSGRLWGAMESIGVTLDLEARKIVPIGREAHLRLQAAVVQA